MVLRVKDNRLSIKLYGAPREDELYYTKILAIH